MVRAAAASALRLFGQCDGMKSCGAVSGGSSGKGKVGLRLTLAQGTGFTATWCGAGGCVRYRGGEGGCVESWKIICEK